jgi:hypothetical protein
MASVSDRLKKSAAAPKPKAGKNEKPVVSGSEILVDQVVKMKKELEDLEAKYAEVEGSLKDISYEAYCEARKRGQFSNSILCEGKDTNGCMQVYSDKFSTLPTEMEKKLRDLDPDYDKHFYEKRTLKIKCDQGKTISDARIEEILQALGDKFDTYVEVKVEIGAKPGTAENWEELPPSIQDVLRDLQAKPSTRNLTVDGKVV